MTDKSHRQITTCQVDNRRWIISVDFPSGRIQNIDNYYYPISRCKNHYAIKKRKKTREKPADIVEKQMIYLKG